MENVKGITSGDYMSCYMSISPESFDHFKYSESLRITPNTLNTTNTLKELNTSKTSGFPLRFPYKLKDY